MSRPIILIDTSGRISYRNRVAGEMLERRDPVYEHEGTLACHDPEGSRALAQALAELNANGNGYHANGYGNGYNGNGNHGHANGNGNGNANGHGHGYAAFGAPPAERGDRRSFRLTRRDGRIIAATVIALRPQVTSINNRRAAQALFTIFEPGQPVAVDPMVLTTAFGVTPAETRLVLTLVTGHSPEECASLLKVKISTIRTHLLSIYSKTGATGQADLVRIVLSAAI